MRIFTRDGRTSLLLMINDILVNRDGLFISITIACFTSLESVLLSHVLSICMHSFDTRSFSFELHVMFSQSIGTAYVKPYLCIS